MLQLDQLEATLPGTAYLGDDWFRREVAAIFRRDWYCAGRREGLDAKGDYRLVDVAGESLLLVCDAAGELHAFFNICRHRGAQLVPGDGDATSGCFRAGIRCPYHSWHYRLDGRLEKAPHLDLDTTGIALHRAALAEWGGYVFLRLDGAGYGPGDGPGDDSWPELEASLGPGLERIRRYPLADLRVGARIDYDVAANWKVILENYNECYHCAGVHPELCRVVPAFRQGGGAGLDWDDGIPQRDGTNTFTFSGTTSRAPFPGLDDSEKVRHKGELFYPNLMLSLSMDHVASFVLQPTGPGHTRIRCEFLFHPDEMAGPGFDPSDAVEFWDLVNRQDWGICESVQRGMNSSRFESGYYAPMEDWSLDIRNYVRGRLESADLA